MNRNVYFNMSIFWTVINLTVIHAAGNKTAAIIILLRAKWAYDKLLNAVNETSTISSELIIIYLSPELMHSDSFQTLFTGVVVINVLISFTELVTSSFTRKLTCLHIYAIRKMRVLMLAAYYNWTCRLQLALTSHIYIQKHGRHKNAAILILSLVFVDSCGSKFWKRWWDGVLFVYIYIYVYL